MHLFEGSYKKLHVQPNRIGKRGAWVVPAGLRRRYGLEEGSLVIAEPRPDDILLKPAIASPALTAAATADSAWQEWFDLHEKPYDTLARSRQVTSSS